MSIIKKIIGLAFIETNRKYSRDIETGKLHLARKKCVYEIMN